MSAGIFVTSKYQIGTAGAIHPVRVQPETIAAAVGATTNAAPAGAVTNNNRLKVSAGRREKPGAVRKVRITAPLTGQPAGYKPGGQTTLVALTQAFYAACVDGASVSYLGATFTVAGRSPETLT